MGKGKIKKYSIDKVYQTMNIVDVIGDFVELKKSGAEYSGLSPITKERTPSLMVNEVKNVWKDFSSGKGGRYATSFLTDVKDMTYPEAIEYVANKYGIGLDYEDGTKQAPRTNEPIIHTPRKPIAYSYHDNSLVLEYGRGFKENNFVQYLKKHFPAITIEGAILNYRLGTSTHVPGAAIFWYVDNREKVTYGKVIQYDRTTGSSKDARRKVLRITSMKSLMGLKDFYKRPNLFGAHLINDRTDFYGIVESEKTAVIMSMIDDRLTWLATGGTSNLSLDLLAPLGNKNVILFPDAPAKEKEKTAFDKWNDIANKAKDMGYKVTCSTTLEEMYGHLTNGYDLADHYLNLKAETPVKPKEVDQAPKQSAILSPDEIKCNKLNEKNGALKTLISELDLVLEDGQAPRLEANALC